MAAIKLVYGSSTETCWSSTNKITTPSLILNDDGTIRYTPLFSGSAGGYGYSGDYRYTLGHLMVDGKRVALSQQKYKFYNSIRLRAHNTSGFSTAYSHKESNYPYTVYYTHYYDRYYYITYDSLSTSRGTLNYVRCSCNSGVNANYNAFTLVRHDRNTYTYSHQDNQNQYPPLRTANNRDFLFAVWTTTGCTNNTMQLNSSYIPWNNFKDGDWDVSLSGVFQLA